MNHTHPLFPPTTDNWHDPLDYHCMALLFRESKTLKKEMDVAGSQLLKKLRYQLLCHLKLF